MRHKNTDETRDVARNRVDGSFWYDSMQHFAAAKLKPIEAVRLAKNIPEACEFFKGSRVSDKLDKWLNDHPDLPEPASLDKERLECERIEKQNRKLDFEHQVKLQKYVLRDDAKAEWARGMEVVQKVVLTFLDKGIYNKAIREMKRELEALDL